MARSRSSKRWLAEHARDPYVRKAKGGGYRSRAAYKLVQIAERDALFRGVRRVVDLGAAPGGWSQAAAAALPAGARVVACDLLPMEPLEGVRFVQGDFRETAVREAVLEALPGGVADLVLSDLAPNFSGIAAVDQARARELADAAAEFAARVLAPGGTLLVKLFQGEDFEEFLVGLRRDYRRVLVRKPAASRARSSESYVLARGYGV